MTTRRKLVAGNWKMHGSHPANAELLAGIVAARPFTADVAVCVPFPYLASAAVTLAGSGARFQPVWVDDVARAVVGCLDRPQTIGQVIECTGPQVCTLSELVRLAGRWSGHERAQLPLPESAGRLQALLMELLPGTPLMSRDNVDSMRVPNVASGQLPGLEALGIQPVTLEAVAPGYLGRSAGCARLDKLRAGAGRG